MPSFTPAPPSSSPEADTDNAWSGWRGPVLIGLIIFCCAIIGILGRPLNFVSAMWPANPVLAGLMVRHPQLARRPAAWLGAFLGFLAADLLTGSSLFATLWFTTANMAGSGLCCWVLLRTDTATRLMQGHNSALALFAGALAAAFAAAAVGGGTGPVLFQAGLWPSMSMWLGGELLSYVLVLPVLLAFPRRRPSRWSDWVEWNEEAPVWLRGLPLVSVALALAAALAIGGPGTLSFVVPALLWCALSYSFLATAALCLVVCLILTVEVAMGSFQFTPEFWLSALSLRVGITLLALGPLAVASNRVARKHAIDRLDRAINHDFLTGLLSRSAFFQRARTLMAPLSQRRAPMALLVLDLDHFKRINDGLGHAAGDDVLRQFSHVAASRMRTTDLLGRMGGEEFLALLPEVSAAQAQALAQQLCEAVRSHPFSVAGHTAPVRTTVSIGVVYCSCTPSPDEIDALIHSADMLLYQAKQSGRDQAVMASHSHSPASPIGPYSRHPLNRRHAAKPR